MPSSRADLAPTRALVDLANLRHNLHQLERHARGVRIFGVVKADAYGHGAVPVSQALVEQGVEGLAVATVPEGLALRDAGIGCRILVFGAPRQESISACSENDLESFVVSVDSLHVIRSAPELKVHLHIDTGMGRLGVRPEEVPEVLSDLETMAHVELVGVSTHFARAGAAADPFTDAQWTRFLQTLESLGGSPAPIHLASSSAIFTVPDSVDPNRISFARPGIALYGLLDLPPGYDQGSFKPVMTLVSEVAQVKTVSAGTPISYDGRWIAPRETRIATVAAGYADGYPRNLTNRATVGIRGRRYRVVGTICMDLFMVDLGPAEPGSGAVRPGDPVVLFGDDGPSALEVAETAETLPYELVSRVGIRVPRVYLGGNARPDDDR